MLVLVKPRKTIWAYRSKATSRAHEEIKLVRENLRKKTCSLYIRASKTTKELVKENLVVCAGHLQDGVRITKIKFWKCLKINSFNKTTLAIYRRFYNLLDR